MDELAALRQSRGTDRGLQLQNSISDRNELRRMLREDPLSEDERLEATLNLNSTERDIRDLVNSILGRAGGAGAGSAAAAGRSSAASARAEREKERLTRDLVAILINAATYSEAERAQIEIEQMVASLDEIAHLRALTLEDIQEVKTTWTSRVNRMWNRAFQNALNEFAFVVYGIDARAAEAPAPVGPAEEADGGAAAAANAGAGAGPGDGVGPRRRARSESESEDEDIREAKRRSLVAAVAQEEEDAELQAALAASLRAGATDEMLLQALRERPDLRFSHNHAAMRVCSQLGLRKCLQFLSDSA